MTEPSYLVKTDKSTKFLQATKKVYPMVKQYLEEAAQAQIDKSKKVCYITGAGIVELTHVFGDKILPVFPENFNATCAAKQVTPPLLEIAESEGYSHDLCGYVRNALGYMLGGKDSDLDFGSSMPPVPEILLSDSGSCTVHLKWWRVYERHFNYKVPTFIFDTPYIPPHMSIDNVEKHYLDYTISQIKEAIKFLEKVTGQEFDEERLKKVVEYAAEATDLFNEALELRKSRPSPAGSEDIVSCIMPMLQWSGTKQGVDYYRELRDEIKSIVDQGKGPIPKEDIRILFDNIPPWFSLGLFNYLHKFNAVSVAETYTKIFHLARGRMDPSKPYESLARKFLYGCTFMSSVRESIRDITVPMAKDYQVDGVISYNLYGCKIASTFLPLQKHILEKEYGIPTLILEGDMVDPRDYADAQVKNRIEAFMEMLSKRK